MAWASIESLVKSLDVGCAMHMVKGNDLRKLKNCLVPNWQELSKAAIDVVYERFDAYGNAWIKHDAKYFGIRMQNEVDEFKKAMSDAERRRKCLNILNLAMMAHTVCNDAPKETCAHVASHEDLVASIDKVITMPCIKCKQLMFITSGLMFDTEGEAVEYHKNRRITLNDAKDN